MEKLNQAKETINQAINVAMQKGCFNLAMNLKQSFTH
jgi:hypothetical protein